MYQGDEFILELLFGNKWLTLGGMQITRFEIRRDKVNINDICISSWQELSSSGLQYISVNVAGICSNSLAEKNYFN